MSRHQSSAFHRIVSACFHSALHFQLSLAMKCAELQPKNLLFQTEPIQLLPAAESLLFTARLQVVTVLNQGQLLLKIKLLTSFFIGHAKEVG